MLFDDLEVLDLRRLEFGEVVIAVADIAQLHFVERSGHFLAVARHEGNGAFLFENELDDAVDLRGFDAEFSGDFLDELIHAGSTPMAMMGKENAEPKPFWSDPRPIVLVNIARME